MNSLVRRTSTPKTARMMNPYGAHDEPIRRAFALMAQGLSRVQRCQAARHRPRFADEVVDETA